MIENTLFKDNDMNKSIKEDKLYRRIIKYYNDNQHLFEILISLCEVIPIKEFYYSFIYEKIKEFDVNNTENNLKLFEKLNNNKNEVLFKELYFNNKFLYHIFNDKLMLYLFQITFFANNYDDISSFFKITIKYFKLIKSNFTSDSLLLFFDYLIFNDFRNHFIFIKVLDLVIDINKETNKFIEKLLEYLNTTTTDPSDLFISELVTFIDKHKDNFSIETFSKNLNEKMKNYLRRKDTILDNLI